MSPDMVAHKGTRPEQDVLSDPVVAAFVCLRSGSLDRMRAERCAPAWANLGRRVARLRSELLTHLTANRVTTSTQS